MRYGRVRHIADANLLLPLLTEGHAHRGPAMTAHGFRSLASSILNEQHWHKDAIERQLAHGERDRIRAAYNHADYLPERRKMMQAWADYCDDLRAHSGKEISSL